jgi:branched-chain amino acid transport system substrate-binding protein
MAALLRRDGFRLISTYLPIFFESFSIDIAKLALRSCGNIKLSKRGDSEETMKKSLWMLTAAMLAVVAGPAFAQDTITIGFTASETGKLNNDSTSQKRGIELWRDDINAKGGIKVGDKSYQVKLVSYDDESQNTRVQQLYTRLITQDKAQFLISPYSSGLVATAAIISEQYGKVMITTGGALEKTYKLGNQHLFQIYSGTSQYLAGALQALLEKNKKPSIAFVYENDPFSKGVAGAVRDQAKKQGVALAVDESYAGSTTDFSPIINKVIASKATGLLGGGHYADGATLARQLHEQKAGLKWVTLLVAPDSPKFAQLGDAAVGISVPSQWEPQAKYKPDFGPTGEAFTKEFTEKYKIAPGYHAAGGYAAGIILQHAMEQAKSIDPEKVTEALNKMDVTTFFGKTKFSSNSKEHGLQVGHQMVLAQWQKKGDKLVKEIIWPDAAKTADAVVY